MCDFRGPPYKMKNNETGEEKEPKFHGFIGMDLTQLKDEGIYHFGATGCGYGYYDGQKFHSCYTVGGKFTFTFKEENSVRAINDWSWYKVFQPHIPGTETL